MISFDLSIFERSNLANFARSRWIFSNNQIYIRICKMNGRYAKNQGYRRLFLTKDGSCLSRSYSNNLKPLSRSCQCHIEENEYRLWCNRVVILHSTKRESKFIFEYYHRCKQNTGIERESIIGWSCSFTVKIILFPLLISRYSVFDNSFFLFLILEVPSESDHRKEQLNRLATMPCHWKQRSYQLMFNYNDKPKQSTEIFKF